jgi:hypothetical protein
MALPGVTITRRNTPPAGGADTDTGKLLVCGLADRGPESALEVTSLVQFKAKFGGRQSYSILYDALDAYFQEGGARALVSRVLGPSAVAAAHNLLDSSSAVSLTVTAKNKGDYGNNLKVQVTHPNSGTFQLVVTESDVLVETSPEFATTAEAAAWEASDYIDVSQGASTNDPATAAAAALTAGTDDRASITDTQWQAALDRFGSDLGPGQVAYPGRTTAAAHAQLEQHAETYGRVAILDGPDTATVATLTGLAATDRDATGARSTRTVPPSTSVAGVMARNDADGVSPNVAAAGDLGVLDFAVGLTQDPWSDTNRETLNDAGVNVIRALYGGFRIYGARTLADPETDPGWLWLANARYFSDVRARAGVIAEEFLFSQINPTRISSFQGALVGEFTPDFTRDDRPLIEPPVADVSENDSDTAAAGRLLATLILVIAPTAERVEVEIVKEAL